MARTEVEKRQQNFGVIDEIMSTIIFGNSKRTRVKKPN